jgi:putative transposase
LKSYRKNQEKLQTLQKKQSEAKKGSSARRKLAKKVSKLHQQIANSRKDHAYNTATQLVETGAKAFYVEKLNLQGLSKRNKAKKGEKLNEYLPNGQSAKSGLNKSWSDAAFGQFFTILEYKAAKAGAIVVKVNPAYTSQLLSYRDEIVFTDCSIREYYDEIERLIVDRDINAGINIKRVGLGLFPTIQRRSAKAKDATQSGVKITKNSTESSAKQVLETLKNVLEANTQSSGVA